MSATELFYNILAWTRNESFRKSCRSMWIKSNKENREYGSPLLHNSQREQVSIKEWTKGGSMSWSKPTSKGASEVGTCHTHPGVHSTGCRPSTGVSEDLGNALSGGVWNDTWNLVISYSYNSIIPSDFGGGWNGAWKNNSMFIARISDIPVNFDNFNDDDWSRHILNQSHGRAFKQTYPFERVHNLGQIDGDTVPLDFWWYRKFSSKQRFEVIL